MRNFVILLNWLEVITKGVVQNNECHLRDHYISIAEFSKLVGTKEKSHLLMITETY